MPRNDKAESRRARRRRARRERGVRTRLWRWLSFVGFLWLGLGILTFRGSHFALSLCLSVVFLLSIETAVHEEKRPRAERPIEDRIAVVFMFVCWALCMLTWLLYALGVIE